MQAILTLLEWLCNELNKHTEQEIDREEFINEMMNVLYDMFPEIWED